MHTPEFKLIRIHLEKWQHIKNGKNHNLKTVQTPPSAKFMASDFFCFYTEKSEIYSQLVYFTHIFGLIFFLYV